MQRTRVAVGQETIELENRLARDWRVTRRTGLRIPRPMAEAGADHVDWHQIARLVRRGSPRRWPRGSFAAPWPGNPASISPRASRPAW